MKRLCICLCFLGSKALVSTLVAHPFLNLEQWDSSYSAINKICQLETISGYESGMFPAGSTVTRYQMAQVIADLHRALVNRGRINSPESRELLMDLWQKFDKELNLQGHSGSQQVNLTKIPQIQPPGNQKIVTTDDDRSSKPSPGLLEQVSAPAPAPVLHTRSGLGKSAEPIMVGGEIRLRPIIRHITRPSNNLGPTSQDALEYRARLNLSQNLGDVQWFMSLQQSGDFGEQNLNPTAFSQVSSPGSGLELLHLGMKLPVAKGTLTAGRQSLRIARPLIWDSQFDQRSRTFDALVYERRKSSDYSNLLFVSRLAEDDPTQTFALNNGTDQDGILYGLSMFRPLLSGRAQGFILERRVDDLNMTPALNQHLGNIGAGYNVSKGRFKLQMMAAWQYGEETLNGRPRFDYAGNMQEISLQTKLASPWILHTEVVRFSGERSGLGDGKQQAFAKLYGSGHSYMGKTDLLDTSNIKSYGLGVSRPIRHNKSLSLMHHWLMLDEAGQAVSLRREMPAYLRTGLLHNPNNQETDLGRELDVTINWQVNDHLVIALTHAWFRSGRYFPGNGVSDFDASFTYLSTELSF